MSAYFSANYHFAPGANDRVGVVVSEQTRSVGLTAQAKDSQLQFWLRPEHIPQLEQALTALWAMQDERKPQAVKDQREEVAA